MASAEPSGPATFRAFERAGWETVAGPYAATFGTLTVQAIGPLLDAVGAGPGVRLLDVATGPGYVAAAAAERGARATGLDFAAVMVAAARRRYPDITFEEGDAEALPFPTAAFEAVTINFGLLHFARPEQALAEAHRVLRPGGRLGFTVWAPPEDAVGFGIILRAVNAHGDPQVPLPPGPPFFRFSDPAESARVLTGLGFVEPRVTRVPQVWRLPSPEAFFVAMLHGTVRTRALLQAQAPAALAAIGEAVRAATAAYRDGTGIALPMPAVLVTATRP
jgi:SAM-dependent methyltransferase